MALNIFTHDDFIPSAVSFSSVRKNKMGGKAVYLTNNSKKIYLQLPYMKAPFGLGSYTDENSNRTTYSVDLNIDYQDTEQAKIIKKFVMLDDLVVKEVAKNSESWLGKKYNPTVIKEALYKPIVRPGKDNYPDAIKLKVLVDNKTNGFIPEAYNHKREPVSLDSIEKGQRVLTIVDINQIWFVDNKCGVGIRLQQIMLAKTEKLPSFAFMGVEDVQDNVERDDEDEDEDEIEVDGEA